MAFVAGLNAYARAHADRISADVQVVLPVGLEDVMAHLQRVVLFAFVANPQSLDAQMKRWADAGSNAWAVAPARSASGHALLLANPHLPWSDFFTWFEAHLVMPGATAYGATLVGMPVPAIAFNDRLGWSHTNNTIDGADLYELQLATGGYRWNDAVRAFDTRTEVMKIRQPDGSMKDESLTIRESVHGPVVREKTGKALALRVAGIDQPNLMSQYWGMIRARSLAEFEAAQRPLQMPFFTVMYADRDGHIMHLFGGRTPVRPAGDYDWSGIVPGTSADTLWTATHTYAQLPRVADPKSGWLQNANDPPWTTTFPLAIDPNAFPKYMAPRGMSLRAQQSVSLVSGDASITFDEFGQYKHSTHMLLADRVLDDLVAAAKTAGGAAASAAAVLAAWDRSANADSRGAVLFEAWYRRASRSGSVFATRWSEDGSARDTEGPGQSCRGRRRHSRTRPIKSPNPGARSMCRGDRCTACAAAGATSRRAADRATSAFSAFSDLLKTKTEKCARSAETATWPRSSSAHRARAIARELRQLVAARVAACG
jgi:acyl-homoserine-lactone acylase